jgi:predicted alpha-1,2-mannosidase
MKTITVIVLCLVFYSNLFAQQQLLPVDYVQPFIGVINEGHCMPGPCLPHGSVYPSPQTPNSYNGGYNVSEKIVGFAQLHAQGTSGVKPYGNFLLSPQLGVKINEADRQSKKELEFTSAYYYKVRLKKYRILCELSPEHNSTLYKFTFPTSDSAVVLLDIGRKNGGEIGIDNGNISITPDGKAMYGGGVYGNNWPDNRHKWNMYFYAEFSQPAAFQGVFEDENVLPEQSKGSSVKKGLGAYLGFKTKANDVVYVKIAVSFISTEHAKQLLHNEIPEWDLEALKANAKAKWNNYLSRIQIEGTEEEKIIFYTHMFHAFVQPRDRTGNNLWKTQEDFWDDHYTLWDSWKTLFPLMTIIDQKMVTSNINAFINRHKHNGYVAEAFVNGKESAIGQGGNTVDNVICDAFVKKIPGVDWEKAYSILKYNADSMRTKGYRELGYMYYKEPNNYSWRVKAGSSTIAFSLNDYCIATMAKGLGKKADYDFYQKRSYNWKNIWNSNAQSDGFSGFIMAKKQDGTFDEIDPKEHTDKHFYEGSCWEYSYEIPHDVEGLVEKIGGKQKFVERLQHAMNDHLINFGNEPSFMTLWLFAHESVQRPDLTSYYVRTELLPLYTRYDLPGDDDQGAMASLYVFARLGFFPLAPTNMYY